MPSTYSPDLRIELIGPGEQAGTWNTTTNNNLGTVLEDAISGYSTVSVTSANQAFTANDGVADQARNATIALTTTTAANFAVYAPPASKQYIINNTTAYVATIYNSTVRGNTTAAGTGVAIPAGKKLVVFSDGTNFSTVEAANLTGVLAVANGGTGVTTSTGTGNTVLSTSPTLVTPALGTPASGTLDNCTSNTEAFGTSNTQLATTAFVQAALQKLYPNGSIYINAENDTDPAALLGFGSWSLFGQGRVLVGFDAADPLFDAAEETGGSKDSIVVSHTHTGSTGTAGTHAHEVRGNDGTGAVLTHIAGNNAFRIADGQLYGQSGVGGTFFAASAGAHSHTVTVDAAGSSGTNANLQPYITVFMWKRVS